MSLSPLSWNHIRRINARYGRRFLAASAGWNGIICVDEQGHTFIINERDGTIGKAGYDTSSTDLIANGLTGTDAWSDTLRQRKRELDRQPKDNA